MAENGKKIPSIVKKTQYLYRLLELSKKMEDPRQFDECIKTAMNEIIKLIGADGGVI